MQFNDFPYRRIDLSTIKTDYYTYIEQLREASSLNETQSAIRDIQQIKNEIESQYKLAYIRYTIDTRDTFYADEMAFWDENTPLISQWNADYYQAVLQSPYRNELEESILPSTFFTIMEQDLSVFDSSIIPHLQEENRLSTKYGKVIASAEIEYKGKTYNLSGLMRFVQSTDRKERKEVNRLISSFFLKHQDEFDQIYDQLVKVRHEMAQQLGFKDFVEVGYARMHRLDYGPGDVEVYRKEVLKHVVPLAQEIFEEQSKRIGIDDLKYYDLDIEFKSGNAIPQGTSEELVAKAVEMYHELSPETEEFIDFMVEHYLLDLETKPGKESGGYCTYIPNFKSPFIFANFNGTSSDVDVLTHEAGHAFQMYQSRWIDSPEVMLPTHESAEIHSMSMEFLTWPWMDKFFGEQTTKYKYSHLAGAIKFLPYGVLVDHFQHKVYENPEVSPAERRHIWRELEKQYLPWKDYDNNSFYEEGGYWFRQLHIFTDPFYYIDYTLAQVSALQFWHRTQVQQDEGAWSDYMQICRVGGTKSFLEILDLAHLNSPFRENVLERVTDSVREYLTAIDSKHLI